MSYHQGNSVLNCNYNSNFSSSKLLHSSKIVDLHGFTLTLSNEFLKTSDPNNGFLPDSSQSISMGPGLYAIICVSTNKVYIGESGNVVERLRGHYGQLNKSSHETKEMQNDWTKYGQSSFRFLSLSVGPQWAQSELRRKVEAELVSLNIKSAYNQSIAGSTKKKSADIRCKPVIHKGTYYPSIAAAHAATGVSETHIRRLARNESNTDWQFAFDPEADISSLPIVNRDKGRPIKIRGVIYKSLRQAEREIGELRSTITRRAKSANPEFDDYTFLTE